MVAVVGFALLGLMVTPVRKQVFLLVIIVITNVMHCMTTTAIMVQKAAVGRSKSPPLAVKKQLLVEAPLKLSPRGENANLLWSFPKVAALTFCSALIILEF